MKQKYEELLNKAHPSVEKKFKEFLYLFLNEYKINPTRRKLAHLLMNVPVGFFIDSNDIKKLLKGNRPPTQDELIAWLSDRSNFINMIKGG